MGREDIKGIVISESELQLGRKVANRTGHNTEKDGGGCAGKKKFRMSVKIIQYLVSTYENQRSQMQG